MSIVHAQQATEDLLKFYILPAGKSHCFRSMGLEVVIAFTIPPFAGTKNDFLSAKSSSISNIIFIEVLHRYIKKFVFKRLSSYC